MYGKHKVKWIAFLIYFNIAITKTVILLSLKFDNNNLIFLFSNNRDMNLYFSAIFINRFLTLGNISIIIIFLQQTLISCKICSILSSFIHPPFIFNLIQKLVWQQIYLKLKFLFFQQFFLYFSAPRDTFLLKRQVHSTFN